MNNNLNRRKWTRLPYSNRILFNTNDGVSIRAKAIDISMEGISIVCDHLLPLGTEGKLEVIQSINDEDIIARLTGHVVRVNFLNLQNNPYGAVIRFSNVDMANSIKLSKILLSRIK